MRLPTQKERSVSVLYDSLIKFMALTPCTLDREHLSALRALVRATRAGSDEAELGLINAALAFIDDVADNYDS